MVKHRNKAKGRFKHRNITKGGFKHRNTSKWFNRAQGRLGMHLQVGENIGIQLRMELNIDSG